MEEVERLKELKALFERRLYRAAYKSPFIKAIKDYDEEIRRLSK